jgi:protein TonB
MRPTLVYSFIFTVLVEGGFAYFGEYGGHGVKPKTEPEVTTLEVIEMPKLDPDPTDEMQEPKQEASSPDIAPPMQQDFPQPVMPDSFVQQIEPPCDSNTKVLDANIVFMAAHGKGGGIGVFDLSALDRAPEVRNQTRPQYPAALRREGVIGEVMVDFIVDTAGNVRNIHVITSTRAEFEEAAVEAVSNWRFKPGRKEGRAVNVHMEESIVFTLDS